MRSKLAIALVLALAAAGAAFAGSYGKPAADIVDTAVAAGDFKTLATALQAAGLIDTLKGRTSATTNALEGLKVVDIIERIYALRKLPKLNR